MKTQIRVSSNSQQQNYNYEYHDLKAIKMKEYLLLFIVILPCIFMTGCYEKYDHTIPVCQGKLFVERYRHNFIDVAYYYLTDSTHFRKYVGRFDNEHGGYSIICNNDSLTISEWYEGEVINEKKYSLVDLRKEGF